MPFRMVSGVGREMGVLDGGGDRRRERDSFGVNVGHPIVTNGNFMTYSLYRGNPKLLWDFLLSLRRSLVESDTVVTGAVLSIDM